MEINDKIYRYFSDAAKSVRVSALTIGLGYTAVELEDGRTGLAYTWLDRKTGCSVIKGTENFEGETASVLLEKIFSEEPIERTLAVAAVNALNRDTAAAFDDDRGMLLSDIGAGAGKSVAMVGFFGPVISQLDESGAGTVVFDIGKGAGNADEFFPFLEKEADALILTSTSILNGSTEDILGHIQDRSIPVVLIGPTTIMKPEIYSHLPVSILAGTVPVDSQKVVQAVRNGRGTPVIQRYARKVYTAVI